MDTTIITKCRTRLDDGSHVYDVSIQRNDACVWIACVTDHDADHFIRKLQAAIEAHTNETCEVYSR
jgi:hypothetical protein